MKKLLALFLSTLLLCGCCPVARASERPDVEKPAVLIVNEKTIEPGAVLNCNEAQTAYSFDLPLIAVLKALGAHVIWLGEKRAVIFYRDLMLQLDPEKGAVYLVSSEENYFSLVGGETPYQQTRRQEGHEYIIDDHAAQSLFTLLEVKMNRDYDNAEIRIDAQGRAPGLSMWANLLTALFLLPFAVIINSPRTR